MHVIWRIGLTYDSGSTEYHIAACMLCVYALFLNHSLTCSRGYIILGVCSSYVLLDPDADLHEVATKNQKVKPH